LLNLINYIRKRKIDTVSIGGEDIELKPLGLESAIELLLILAPYIPLIENAWPKFQDSLVNKNGKRPELLSAVFRNLAAEMQQAPGDMVKVMAILLDKPVEWIAQEATGQELLEALPTIDKVNELHKILPLLRQMVSYGN
jgi:hypothetical protein